MLSPKLIGTFHIKQNLCGHMNLMLHQLCRDSNEYGCFNHRKWSFKAGTGDEIGKFSYQFSDYRSE